MRAGLSPHPTDANPAADLVGTSPALLAALLASAMDAIIALDANQRIVLFNPAAEVMFGCPTASALGQPLDRFLPARFRDLHRRHIAAFGATGSTTRAMGHLRPLAALRADGEEFPIEATISLVEIDGEKHYAAIVRDISARQAADAERRSVLEQEAAARAEAAAAAAQRDHLRAILDVLPGGVFIQADPEGSVEFANSALLELIYGDGQNLGRLPQHGRDFSLLRADGTPLPAAERPGSRALRGERVRNQQLILERIGGPRLPVAAHAAPLREGMGTSGRAVVFLQDVTQMRQAEQLKDDFLALVSHELRTPVTAIHGGAYLLARQGDALDEETRGELLTDIVTESERLERTLVNLTTLTALLGGRVTPTTEPTLVARLIRRVIAEVAPRAPGHTFAIDVPVDLPPAETDPALLEQVLRNLYENAVKYAPGGGEIRTTATSDDGTVTLQVIDKGSGIAPENVAHVFDRFRRVGADPTVRGMGLGLYLSRLLVEAQGGRIWASSRGLGRGATFAVALPVTPAWKDRPDLPSSAGSET